MYKDDIISEVFKPYLDDMKMKKYSPKTIRHYDYILMTFYSFLTAKGITRLQDITTEDIEAYHLYLKDKKFSTGSCENLMGGVKTLFKWLDATNRIFVNPCTDVIMPKRIIKLLPVPTEEEVKRLLLQPDISTRTGVRDRAIMEVVYGCGLRRAEVTGLTVFDPNLNQGTLRVRGKGNKERVVPLGKKAVTWIKKYLKHARPELIKDRIDENSLWLSIQKGRQLGDFGIRQQVREYTIKAKIKTPMNLHSLRRACATHMLANGAHPIEIQLLLGHANLKTLSHYLSVTITDIMKMHKQSKPGR